MFIADLRLERIISHGDRGCDSTYRPFSGVPERDPKSRASGASALDRQMPKVPRAFHAPSRQVFDSIRTMEWRAKCISKQRAMNEGTKAGHKAGKHGDAQAPDRVSREIPGSIASDANSPKSTVSGVKR